MSTVAVALLLALLLGVAWKVVAGKLRKRRDRDAVARFAKEAGPAKRLLFIDGSLRKTGETAALLERLRIHAETLGGGPARVAVEIVHVNELQLGRCIGCGACIALGEERCPLRKTDGFEHFLRTQLLACDALVLASPVYVGGCTGELKKLLDRLAFGFHRPLLVGVPSLEVAEAAVWWQGQTAKFLEVSAEHLGCLSVGRVALTGQMPALRRDAVLKDAMLRLLAHLATPREKWTPSWGQLWAFAIHKSGAHFFESDARYWQERGWFVPTAAYYFPCKMSLAKRLFSLAVSNGFGLFSPKRPLTYADLVAGERASSIRALDAKTK